MQGNRILMIRNANMKTSLLSLSVDQSIQQKKKKKNLHIRSFSEEPVQC